MEQEELWHLTAFRLQGLRLMRPERSWRPIITIEVDKHHSYEFCMGCDGQNPNLKDMFRFRDATYSSILDIKIWQKPQTKRKSKKRNLVATASHSLGELLKRQEAEHNLEIRLQCESKHAISSKAKSQGGALFHIRLRPPSSISSGTPDVPNADANQLDINNTEDDSGHTTPDDGYNSDRSDSSRSSCTADCPATPPSPVARQVSQSGLRRRRIRGYSLYSDDECISEEYYTSSDEAPESGSSTKVNTPASSSTLVCHQDDEDNEKTNKSAAAHSEVLVVCKREIRFDDAGRVAWSVMPILPTHVEEVAVSKYMNAAEEMLSTFTVYRQMKDASQESHFEKVFCRLQQEWTYVGGSLVALAALNTAAFSLSRDPSFRVDQWCQCAIAASSISIGLGVVCDAWLLFRYSWSDLDTFRSRAKDLFDSYFFFCLSARVPALCMLISSVAMMAFLGLVAYTAWPQAVLVVSFFIGLLMTLQFLAYGAMKLVQGGRAGSKKIVTVAQRIRKASLG